MALVSNVYRRNAQARYSLGAVTEGTPGWFLPQMLLPLLQTTDFFIQLHDCRHSIFFALGDGGYFEERKGKGAKSRPSLSPMFSETADHKQSRQTDSHMSISQARACQSPNTGIIWDSGENLVPTESF